MTSCYKLKIVSFIFEDKVNEHGFTQKKIPTQKINIH